MKRPDGIRSADRILIDEDCLRFGQSTAVGRTDWTVTVPFSDIVELEYEASGGKVSGSLRDGALLDFRVDQTLACEVAMRALEDLLGPSTGSAPLAVDDTAASDRSISAWPRTVELAFAAAGRCGVEDQVRRFARLTADAGFEVNCAAQGGSLVVRLPGTEPDVFDMYWYEGGRCRIVAPRTGAFGVDESKVMRALPRQKMLRTMNVRRTDEYLDALARFLSSNAIRSWEAAAAFQQRKEIEGSGCAAAIIAAASVLWFGIVWVFLMLFGGRAPFGEFVGLILSTLLYAAFPVFAIGVGLLARGGIREYARKHPDGTGGKDVSAAWAWVAIILGVGSVLYIAMAFIDELSRL